MKAFKQCALSCFHIRVLICQTGKQLDDWNIKRNAIAHNIEQDKKKKKENWPFSYHRPVFNVRFDTCKLWYMWVAAGVCCSAAGLLRDGSWESSQVPLGGLWLYYLHVCHLHVCPDLILSPTSALLAVHAARLVCTTPVVLLVFSFFFWSFTFSHIKG